jgi:NAD(P)H dehydrogenase (quinone)
MIAVLGASGRVGRHVAAGLAGAGVPARALVRNPETAELPLEAVPADLRRPDTLPAALRGVERLLLLTPHVPDQDLLEAAAVDAAATAGVRRIVKVSGGPPTLGPNGTTATATAHWRSEQRIERSGLEFAFLRPSFFMQNLLETAAPAVSGTGVLTAPFGDAPIAMVDARDVAAGAVAALLDDRPAYQAWHLTGPRPVTFPAIAADVGARHAKVPLSVTAAALRRRGLPAPAIEHSVRMAAYLSTGADGVVTDHVLRLAGAPPRSIEAFLAEHRDAFAPATTLARLLSTTKAT